MKTTCPSCAAVYESDDYPGAFEINCVCGYSILVPAEEFSSRESSNNGFDPAVPTAMDAEDEAMIIRPEGLLALNPDEVEIPSESQGILQMTPSERLPTGMVYDSFELPTSPIQGSNSEELQSEIASPGEGVRSGELDLGNADIFSDSPEVNQSLPVSVDDQSTPSTLARPLLVSSNLNEAHVSKAQQIVRRTQFASMGQFLGSNYELQLQDLNAEGLERLQNLIKKMFLEHPWLDSECRLRGLDFKNQLASGHLKNVPEILALEIYLAVFEMGAVCLFEKQD